MSNTDHIVQEPQSQIRLYKQRASYEFSAAREIFRSSPVSHVAFIHPGDPVPDRDGSGESSKKGRGQTIMNLPLITVIVPEDEDDEENNDLEFWSVYFHSHRKSGLVEGVESGIDNLTATTTIIDGLVLSPTAHDHSLNYRSATLHLSQPVLLPDSDREAKRHSLGIVTNTVAGYERTRTVGAPMDVAVDRTSVVKCKIIGVSCKQRCGAWDANKEPPLEPPHGEDSTRGWKGGIPCWTQWGELAGYGRDGEELRALFNDRSVKAKDLAVGTLFASDNARIEGLGKRAGRGHVDAPLSERI